MDKQNLKIDPVMFAEFIDESLYMLSELDSLFVKLETNVSDLNIVNAIFRPVHSIKGNSSFFDLVKVKKLAHDLESLLDMVRKKTLFVSKSLINILLVGVDELKSMLERVRNNQQEVLDENQFQELLKKIKEESSRGEANLEELWKLVFSQFQNLKSMIDPNAQNIIKEIDNIHTNLKKINPEKKSSDADPWSNAPEQARKIKTILTDSPDGNLDKNQVEIVSTALNEIKELGKDAEAKEILEKLIDSYKIFIEKVGFDILLKEMILEKLEPLITRGAFKVDTKPSEKEPSIIGQEKTVQPKKDAIISEKSQSESHKTMRVSEANIDIFLSYVGELIVIGDMFNNLQRRISENNAGFNVIEEFKRVYGIFTSLSNNLQKSIMSIRKVPVHSLLQKAPRIVRDIAAESGKEIEVILEGETIEVDKSLFDILDAPLTHMVRNAADHGVETPDEREKKGKNRKGTIHVSMVETNNNIVFSIEDDGVGLDYKAIQAKAESLGLVDSGKQLSQKDIINFIFAAGVSTAKKVTEVSGRGVGMDVVKRTIEEIGGSITITSEKDKGSKFRILLPKSVTTQIMQGFLIEVNGQCYVLPVNKVCETSKVENYEIKKMAGKNAFIIKHNELLPIVNLHSVLYDLPMNNNENNHKIMVSVFSQKRKFALSVDKVRGIQQMVHKDIESLSTTSNIITGGALMGDGSVALIIDIDKLNL